MRSDLIFERIGAYRIGTRIAEGGMGVVYRAHHEVTGEIVALKMALAPDPRRLGSIRREIHALSRIRHPGVVRIVDQGVHEGLPWYAMDYVEGRTLRNAEALTDVRLGAASTARNDNDSEASVTTVVLDDEPLRSDEPTADGEEPRRTSHLPPRSRSPGYLAAMLGHVRRLCEPLAFLHGEGIVHHDLKPENVVLRRDGYPVLVDFGLAAQFSRHESLEVTGVPIGTVEYMAPEQIRGELVDARSDLYALGCMLYEILTGQVPFLGQRTAIALQHLRQAPLAPSLLAPGIDPALEALVLQLLSKEPRERLGYAADVAAVLDALEWTARGTPPSLATPSAPRPRSYLYRPAFAGRAELVAALTGYVKEAMEGRGGRVLLGGASGAGKTRLAMEAARLAARAGVRVITGECLPVRARGAGGAVAPPGHGAPRGSVPQPAQGSETPLTGAPLQPFRPLLQAVADHCRLNGIAATETLLGRRGKVLAQYEPLIAGLPGQDLYPEPARLPAQAARERLLGHLADTLRAFAGDEPLLLILDDLQWADELSLGALASFEPELFESTGILLLCTYRTEEASRALLDALRVPGVVHLDLPFLDARAVGSIVGDMLALRSPPAPLVELLVARGAGNPFFIAEYLHAAVSEGILRRGREGRWEVADLGDAAGARFESLPLPSAVRDLCALRLEALEASARRLVEVASVLGRELDGSVLAAIAGMADLEQLAALEELLARQIVEETQPGRFRFAHDTLRDTAYAGVAAPERRGLHHAAARAIEAERGASPDAFPELAHHYAMAEVDEKTFEYLEKAGARALGSGAHAEAAAFFERALRLDDRRDRPSPAVRRARWERRLGEASMGLGDLRGLRAHTRTALEALGERLPHGAAGWSAFIAGEVVRQVSHLARGGAADLPNSDASGDGALLEAVHAAGQIAHGYYYAGDALGMIGTSLLAVNLAERARDVLEVSRPYANLGYVAGLARLHPLARSYFRRACAVGMATDDASGLAFSLASEAAYHVGGGAWEPARASAGRALGLLLEIGDRQEAAIAQTLLGHVEHFTGRFDLSCARFAELLDSARSRSNIQHEAWGLYAWARSLLPLGQVEEATALLLEARSLLRRQADEASSLICDGLLAVAHLRAGKDALARAAAGEAAARIRRSLPTVFSTVHGYEGAAEVYLELWERAGDDGAGRAAMGACRALWLFAQVFPLGAPASLRCRARAHRLAGHRGRARRAGERSLRVAGQMGMPYEEARAHEELGRAVGGGEGEAHRAEARRLLAGLGCDLGR